jgi:hypothetical protein
LPAQLHRRECLDEADHYGRDHAPETLPRPPASATTIP